MLFHVGQFALRDVSACFLVISRRQFLYVGNLEPRKDVPTLLKAWRACGLSQQYDLVLAGAPAYLADDIVCELTSAGTSGVRWLGFVTDAQKYALLAAATCFVYPSVYEGFGIPVLEAMSCGTPVVTTTASALVELTGGNAVHVPIRDPESLAEAMVRLAADPAERERLRTAGSTRAAEYSWARTAEATTAGYERARNLR